MNHCGYVLVSSVSSTFYSFLPTPNNIEPRAQQIDSNRCIFGDTEQGTHRNTPRNTWSIFTIASPKVLRRNVTLLHVNFKSGVLETVHQQRKSQSCQTTVNVLHGVDAIYFTRKNCGHAGNPNHEPTLTMFISYFIFLYIFVMNLSSESARSAFKEETQMARWPRT